MKKAVICLCDEYSQADNITQELFKVGFVNNDISLLYPNSKEPVSNSLGSRDNKGNISHEKNTKAPEGAATGAVTGGLLGGSLGLLLGIGALSIPGLGPFIAAGPIMAALGGAAVGGGVGLLTGSLIGMGIPEYEAKAYLQKIKEGKILISVHTENEREVEKAKGIFKTFNAHDISSKSFANAPSPASP